MKLNNVTKTIIAVIPVLVLVSLLALNISIFGADSILGASQVALLFSAGICVWLGMWLYKTPWKDFEDGIKANVGDVTTAIVILFLIGAISGTWMVSGVVPTFIYYGVKIISPKVFLLTATLLCAIVSMTTGSSWTTIATIGVALLGIGRAEGFSDGLIAGAIISGAYFGDKVSPMSDTTVLASSLNRVHLFEHIKYLTLTTGPSILVSLVIFTVLGLAHKGTDAQDVQVYTDVLSARFIISPWLFVVPLLTALMIWRRMPAMMVLALSSLTAAVAALLFQPDLVYEVGAGVTEGSRARILLAGTIETIYNSVTMETGNETINALLTSRGMLGMLNTVYLIICAMCFGACMQASGMIRQLSRILEPLTHSRTGLVASTVATGTVLNGLVSDQYLSIILTSNIFRDSYQKGGYEGRLLSRSVEDSATVTSPLFPWSSCGMTQATILSVPTLVYAPYCFFCFLSPLMSVLVAAIGWKIVRKSA